ncbi:MAG: N-acetyltransferase [Proteobacteria bacterium]|nr:MAG: N-acetyltransferase [Pseudomonadota bacterium]
MFEFESLHSERVLLRPTPDEDSYLLDMKISHRELEPAIYTPALDFRFHPGKVLIDICPRSGENRMGGFSIHGFSDDLRACEFGYWILPDYQGQGYVVEAGKLLLKYLFQSQTMTRVTLVADIRNKRSVAVAQRLGFAVEGVLQGRDLITEDLVTKLVYARYDAEGLNL